MLESLLPRLNEPADQHCFWRAYRLAYLQDIAYISTLSVIRSMVCLWNSAAMGTDACNCLQQSHSLPVMWTLRGSCGPKCWPHWSTGSKKSPSHNHSDTLLATRDAACGFRRLRCSCILAPQHRRYGSLSSALPGSSMLSKLIL